MFSLATFKMNKKELLEELKREGIKKDIIKFLDEVDRKDFVPAEMREQTYYNIPLAIGAGQTISQPYTVAYMLQNLELKKGDKVLEIGTGSGWNAALMSRIVGSKGKVYTIEILKELAQNAKNRLKKYKNIKVIFGSGAKGLKKYAPYDKIIFTAAPEKIDESIKNQLKEQGVLLAPVGKQGEEQRLIKILRTKTTFIQEDLGAFVFVPLV